MPDPDPVAAHRAEWRRSLRETPILDAALFACEPDELNQGGALETIEEFAVPEKLYAERARASAVPGYAVVTLNRRWMAPGEMGWFGMSSDSTDSRTGYQEAANAYIGTLPDDAWLTVLDCHI